MTIILSNLNDHDWNILSSNWSRGSDWTVEKVGSRWQPQQQFGDFPKYRTKTAAVDAVDERFLAEATRRALLRAA